MSRTTVVENHCFGGITLVQSDNCVQQLSDRQEKKKITEAEIIFFCKTEIKQKRDQHPVQRFTVNGFSLCSAFSELNIPGSKLT
jgi:hypothetical protein